ncbi:MAG: hypothetical protein K6B41_11595 [Butyrivibrio sp.]|nr:hypothetical protein [Butyrivibrio sp.]
MNKDSKAGDFYYPEKIFVYEKDGRLRQFSLQHRAVGINIYWEADEIDGEYRFRYLSKSNEDIEEVLSRFKRKILAGIGYKSISRKHPEKHSKNVLERNGDDYTLGMRGNVEIRDDGKGNVNFCIDGEIFSPDEFAKMLGPYVGSSLCFQIQDITEPLLEKNDFLVAIKVTAANIMDDFVQIVEIFTDEDNYLEEDELPGFEEAMWDLVDRLDILYHSEHIQDAIDVGTKIIKQLNEISCDDPDFPSYDIEMIENIILGYS